ncbi:hypothetical protein [Bradyrhizobium sp.]|uniref:hypothetical protein n=1 Tax=Bradyrhizobium sp. TaxID=376 RepID=UPI003C3F9A1D
MVRPARLRDLRLAIAGVLAATIAATAAFAANAQDRQALRDACGGDMRAVCSGVLPGGGRIKQCMLDHFDQLSNGCKSAMKQAQARAQSPGK